MFNNSFSRVSISDLPPRKSYERFIREETIDSIINSLADHVLDIQKPEHSYTTIDHRVENQIKRVEFPEFEEDQENIDQNK